MSAELSLSSSTFHHNTGLGKLRHETCCYIVSGNNCVSSVLHAFGAYAVAITGLLVFTFMFHHRMSPDRNESQLRELRAAVERAFAVPVPEPDHPGYGQEPECRADTADGRPTLQFKVGTQLKDIECKVIVATLDYCHGRKPETARLLGVSLKTLYNRLNQYQQMRS